LKLSGPGRQREPATPRCIELIEKGELGPFDDEIYPNFNTGLLETYLEERNRERSFEASSFRWSRLLILILVVGIPFTFITQYIALETGMVLSSVFYVAYIVGLALRWKPNEINITASAANLVDNTVVGFVYVFPAIFLLARSSQYAISPETSGSLQNWISGYQLVGICAVTALFASLLSLFFFIVFRRLWVIEDPLPAPGFESLVELMDLANTLSRGLRESSRTALKKMGIAGALIFLFAFIRDFPFFGTDSIFKRIGTGIGVGDWIYGSYIRTPPTPASKTSLSISLSGLVFSIGWYMRWRTALILLLGSAFMWFVIVPIAILTHSPYYWPLTGEMFDVSKLGQFYMVNLQETNYFGIPSVPIEGASSTGNNVALGCLLGAGLTTLIKTRTSMIGAVRDLLKRREMKEGQWVEGKGWYEWPSSQIPIVAGVSFAAIFVTLWLIGGFNPIASVVASLFFLTVGFILHAISVKTAGEAGIGPTIGILTLSILSLFFILKLVGIFVSMEGEIILLTLIATTAFGASMAIPVTVLWDYKTGHYIGTRPFQLFKAQSVAIIVGIPFSAFIAFVLADQLSRGDMQFRAPQARAFASFITILTGGKTFWLYIILGLVVGVLLEMMTGLGTVFGLGMFFPMGLSLTVLIGGIARDYWEMRLKRKYGRERDWGQIRTLKLIDTYMVMTGLFLGEAIMGLVLSIYLLVG